MGSAAARPFLADFGLARSVVAGSSLTASGEALGTPAYMSPEQARGEVHSLTPATDVWALGCVCYRLLAGRPPFEGESAAEVMAAVLTGTPPPLGRLSPTAPSGLQAVLAAALAKRASARYAHAGALGADLERVLAGRRPCVPRRRSRVFLALAASGALLAGAGGLLVGRGGGPGAEPSPAPAVTEAEALARRARQLRQSAPERAAEAVAAALALAPTRDDWRVELGLLRWATGDGIAACEAWAQVRPDSPLAARARLYRGLEAVFRLAGAEAVPHLRPLAEGPAMADGVSDPASLAALARGALAVCQWRFPLARRELRGLPGWEAALLRGYVEQRDPAGDRNLAVRELDRAIAEGIPFAWSVGCRGVAKRDLGDPTGALADFDASLALDPRSTRALSNRGLTKEDLGDRVGARADYDAALRIDPGCVDALVNRGGLRSQTGDAAGARADYDAAIACKPDSWNARFNRGALRRLAGDLAGAVEDFDAALAVDPRSAPTLVMRGVAKRQAGDVVGAIADYDHALALDPQLPRAWFNRGIARVEAGRIHEAIADFDAALALEPGHVEARYNRADAKHRTGDLAGALTDLDAVVALAPDLPKALAARGQIRLETGDVAGAEADLERALGLASPGSREHEAIVRLLARARATGARPERDGPGR